MGTGSVILCDGGTYMTKSLADQLSLACSCSWVFLPRDEQKLRMESVKVAELSKSTLGLNKRGQPHLTSALTTPKGMSIRFGIPTCPPLRTSPWAPGTFWKPQYLVCIHTPQGTKFKHSITSFTDYQRLLESHSHTFHIAFRGTPLWTQ